MNSTLSLKVELTPEEKRALLARLLRKKTNKPNSSPVSYAQQRFWFIEQFTPGNSAYHIPAAVRLVGQLDLAALARSFTEIIRRHEVLRTTFVERDGRAEQLIAPPTPVGLPLADLSGQPAQEREAELQRLATAEAARAFDLGSGPLLRVCLLRLDREEHALLLTMHHIISDGWSVGVLIRELGALYAAYSRGQESPLAELPLQYADYAQWQRNRLHDEALAEQLAYWRNQLQGAPSLLALPTDRPRPAMQTFSGAAHTLMFPPELSAALKSLSQREGVTLFMTLLAAFQMLLCRYTGQMDISVGTPIANRNRAEVEGLIGLFANTLVLRTNLDGNPSFRELLQRVKEVALGAYARQDLPFEKLVEELQPERSLSHSPLFQVMFVLQHASAEAPELRGLTLQSVEAENATAKFDLTLSITDATEGLRGAFEYNTDLFDAATIERMSDHFRVLLEAIADSPHRRISALPLLPDAERRQLLQELTDTARLYPKGECMHHLFDEQVERSPDAVAVRNGGARLTFRELDERANQLARHLQALGVGPESLVGICVERSMEMVVGLLGIHKAGGAYVPLDPAYPRQRLGFILEDANVAVVLTQRRLLESLPAHAAHVVCLDADWGAIAGQSTARPVSQVSAGNVAYIIYTSGSTGRPKGVAIEHRNAVTLLHWAREVFALEDLRGMLASTSICFDLSVFELFVPLSWGGTVILAENALQLLTLPEKEDVTLINTVPSAMAELLRMGGVPGGVRTVNLAGEILQRKLVEEIYAQRQVEEVLNLYGPSEDTTYSTFATVKRDEGSAPPIGRPVADTQVYLLDSHLNLVPFGIPGEIFIGGGGLARGYLNRPELTADRFIPNPFSAQPGTRLYRTGDLARYAPGGNLEYLGRSDYQVKIRGFRIELGEVEAVLAGHERVRDVVVVAKEGGESGTRLVAYIVAQGGGAEQPLTAPELRRFMLERLPKHMAPSVYVMLDEMPLSPNGKVDRRALPEPESPRASQSGDYVAPRTPLEEMVASIWAGVLGLEEVGVHDNFFDLGGHSLLATRVISRLREAFHVEMPVRSLFESATVAELTESIEQARSTAASVQTAPILPVSRERELPLSFAQQRLWFFDRLRPNSAFYNVPAALHLEGRLDVGALEQALGEVVRRHEALRTTFAMVDGQAVQVIAGAAPVGLRLIDLSGVEEGEREAQAERLAAAEAERPFDLTRGPLMRAMLLRLGPESHVIVLLIHHIVADGWSMGLLIEEAATLYEAFSQKLDSPLEELPIQYADYAVWQRESLQGESLEKQLDYWKQQLAGAPAVLNLSAAKPRPTVQTFRGAQVTQLFPVELAEKLRALSRREGVTLFMALLAAYQTLLAWCSGEEDIVVGAPNAGRNRRETEALIGFFVNTLVMRTDLSGDPRFRELLKRVREVALGAYTHQDIPFEKLVEELAPERSPGYMPLVQVAMVLQNTPPTAAPLTELKLTEFPMNIETARFDLHLSMSDAGPGLSATLTYNVDLFEADTINRMLDHFQTLLNHVVEHPDATVHSVFEMLDEAERRRRTVKESQFKKISSHQLKSVRRRAVRI
jgi:amino acid adenylation domain-containing protein